MKNFAYIFTSFLALFCSSISVSQQRGVELERNLRPVKKYTLIERFEPELALSANERERIRAERFAEVKLKIAMLDTMDISERKREKLLSDIIERPFSTRLSRNMAESQFEEEK